ncbi:MAG: TetR/AcrR family transcriptional regulator [Acidovorax sp.]|jgi:TetR/AcrR family transcriptional repressor of lmrAB and yxaGH operons
MSNRSRSASPSALAAKAPAPAPGAPAPSTRERLIQAMARALRERGLHGVGLTEVLADAEAPKGVLYHHFPGGKAELATAAIDAVTEAMVLRLQTLLAAGADPVSALTRWVGEAERQLVRSRFTAGCPLATVALETTPDDQSLRQALDTAFARIRSTVADALVATGIAPSRAQMLAGLVLAAYEGGLLQARVAQDGAVLQSVLQGLVRLIEFEIPGPGPAGPDALAAPEAP